MDIFLWWLHVLPMSGWVSSGVPYFSPTAQTRANSVSVSVLAANMDCQPIQGLPHLLSEASLALFQPLRNP